MILPLLQYWIIPSIVISHHNHTTDADLEKRERSAKFTFTGIKSALTSKSLSD